jgi:hypothetical protein
VTLWCWRVYLAESVSGCRGIIGRWRGGWRGRGLIGIRGSTVGGGCPRSNSRWVLALSRKRPVSVSVESDYRVHLFYAN